MTVPIISAKEAASTLLNQYSKELMSIDMKIRQALEKKLTTVRLEESEVSRAIREHLTKDLGYYLSHSTDKGYPEHFIILSLYSTI